jgi:hypothetical protein
MTVLGKILVIVNLVFSLATGALIVMVFAKQTNWKDAADKWHRSYDVARANADAYAQEMEENKKKGDELKTNTDRQLGDLKDQLAKLQEKSTFLENTLKDEQGKSKVASANTVGATEESRRLNEEVKALQGLVNQREDKLVELDKQAKDFRERAVAAEIAYRTAQGQNQRLLETNETLVKDLEREKAKGVGTASTGGASTTATLKPPPEDVEGVVLDSDPKTGLVTISIGSDSGISKGNTLEIFRYHPKPDYVGMIRIVDARPHEAVGRAIMPLRSGPIQKGDRVASTILGRK